MNDHEEETMLQPGNDRPKPVAPRQPEETGRGSNTPGASAPAAGDPLNQGTPDQTPESVRQALERSATFLVPPFTAPGYRLVRELGRGTFGDVWLAEQKFEGGCAEKDRVQVAIKFFRGRNQAQVQRMVDEARILIQLRSDPRIVYLVDHDADAETPFFVMDYQERGSLAAPLSAGPMPIEEALPLFREIVEAMAFVHAKGIRHCDLKPGNILISVDGKPKVADFGQAHLSLAPTEQALGTFFYMAPDQANVEHQVPDCRWDVYGLGALLFAMITGKPPHYNRKFSDELALTASITTKLKMYRCWVEESQPPSEHRQVAGMDRALADIIDRCLVADPAKRLRDAGDLLAALERRERNRRQRPFIAITAMVVCLLLFATAAFGYFAVNRAQFDLENHVLDSDLITANLVAQVVHDNLKFESMRLKGMAANQEVASEFLNYQNEIDVVSKKQKHRKLEQFLENKIVHSRFNSFTIFDQGGVLRVAAEIINPENRENPVFDNALAVQGRQYTWRNYWNRQQDYLERKGDIFPYGPNLQGSRDVPYIGQPFVSTAKSRYRAITISMPVYKSPASKEMIGLLMGSVLLEDLHNWIEPIKEKGGCAVLIERHGYCVLHHQLDAHALDPAENEAPEIKDFRLREPHWYEGRTTQHLDPYTEEKQLAVHVPIADYGWHVIVQHPRGTVLRQMDQVRRDLFWGFVSIAVGASLVLPALWWGFSRLWRGR